MKSKFAAFTLLLATVFLMASCLDSDNDYTYTDDCAISSFSVTTAKQKTFVKLSSPAIPAAFAEWLNCISIGPPDYFGKRIEMFHLHNKCYHLSYLSFKLMYKWCLYNFLI